MRKQAFDVLVTDSKLAAALDNDHLSKAMSLNPVVTWSTPNLVVRTVLEKRPPEVTS